MSDLLPDLGMLSFMFSSFLVTREKKKNEKRTNSIFIFIWPGLTAFSFQATFSAIHPLNRHCHQERH